MTTKSNIKMFLDNLSITDKVDILKELYKDISGLGVDGDTQLAHINSSEADLLRSVGGAGTLHMTTGLPQYKGGGGGAPSSVYQQQNQSSRLSEEAAPFAKDVLTEAQDYYRGILNQGYDPYTGAITAPQTQEQIDAQAGIKGLAGTGTALQQEGLDLYRQQGERFTPEIAAEYQSPYQQAVTDVEKRKAVEDFQEKIMPQFEKQAVQAGGMSGLGSRAGVQASLLGSDLGTRLGDIQTRGLQSSYMDAQKLFQDQKRREQGQASATAQLGPAMFGQGLAEQGAIQTVGEQKRALAQSALDEQYYKYLEQKAFPEEQLAKYSGFVYGNPLLSERDVSSTASAPGAQGPSTGAQLLGAGLTAANTFRQFNQPQTGGANTFIGRAGGGGLSDIVYRAEGDKVLSAYEADQKRLAELPEYDSGERGWDRVEREAAAIAQAQKVLESQKITSPEEDFEAEGRIGDHAFVLPRDTDDRISQTEAAKMTSGTTPDDTDYLNDSGLRSMLPKAFDRYDPEQVEKRATAREALRSGYYADSDRERREYREGMFDRRRDERKEDYARQKALIGKPDPWGTLLDSLAGSLTRTRDPDPRNPDSANAGIFGRLQEGLLESSDRLSAGDKARRKELLKLEDEFSKRRSAESEKEFEAEGEDFTRADERKALSLARKFKLEDKILGLPYEKQKRALELINSGLKGEKLKAEINKLNAEAAAEGTLTLDATTAKALDDTFKDQLTQVIPDALSMDGIPMNAKVAQMISKAKEKAQEAYVRGGEDATAARRSFQKSIEGIRDAMKINPKYFSEK